MMTFQTCASELPKQQKQATGHIATMVAVSASSLPYFVSKSAWETLLASQI
jgi:hypothetical protein